MTEMLTAKEMQGLLQVDRSTIYRMAEAGRLPAIKIGKQWRFPADQVENWLGTKTIMPSSQAFSLVQPKAKADMPSSDLESLLPLECVELILDTYADLLGVMLVVTDMDGNPISQISNPCGLFDTISQKPDALQKCIHSWHELATTINLEPRFHKSHLGLLCTRGMVRVGKELKGMIVAGCVAPKNWPPSLEEIGNIAREFNVTPEKITTHLEDVYFLDESQQSKVLEYVQRIANIIAHIVSERNVLMGKLEAIVHLAKI